MLVLTIRTDKPEAEIGLFDDATELEYRKWTAHRDLGRTLHSKLADMLKAAGKDWGDIQGVLVYKGPGSFTGLRIGLTVADVLAEDRELPIVGETGDNWLLDGLGRLAAGENDQLVMPEYGGEANITQPKH